MKPNISLLLIFSLLSIPIATALPHFFRNITDLPKQSFPTPWESFKNLSGCHLGDRLDGLAKVKQYFHQFGYLPNSVTNFTDDFDTSLESALKTYQLNFNLNDTGVLDDSTLSRIALPRCGVADVINGSSTMKSGSGSGTSNSDIHAVAHYSFFPRQPRWPSWNRDLTYAFAPENQLTNTVKAVFARAFARWAAVTPLTFTETNSFSTADITIGFFGGSHGDGEPFDGVLGTLAHAFSPPDGRFHLDEDESWVVGSVSTSEMGYSIDLESVAVHEIGHLLGLGHSSVEDAIMFPTISTGTRKTELASDDVEGIQVLYGGNPNYNGSETTGTASENGNPAGEERERSDGGVLLEGRFKWVMAVMIGCIIVLIL